MRSRVDVGFGKTIMAAVGSIMRTNNLIMGGVGCIMGLERQLWMQ